MKADVSIHICFVLRTLFKIDQLDEIYPKEEDAEGYTIPSYWKDAVHSLIITVRAC